MFRTLLFYTLLIPGTIFYGLVAIIFGTPHNRVTPWTMRNWAKYGLWAAGIKVDADLSQLVQDGKPRIFLANHQSNFDIFIILKALYKFDSRFVAKKSLFYVPFMGWAMWRVGNIAIDRSNRRRAMRSIDQAAKRARENVSIILFPEGTRNKEHARLREFQIGGMIMALKCRLPVTPVVLAGAGSIQPKGSWYVKPRTVHLKVLETFDATEKYTIKQREQFKNDLYEQMNTAYLEMMAQLPGEEFNG